ncbi:MAG: GNAT family N-acetyltransferase [Humidesulfovibrio sp.]|nr:GNAT family N-acetyltransferase [Humidesulfovibrio sp.]
MDDAGSGYLFRRMERTELDFALKLAAAEGWNPGLRDADAFWAADPEGFHLGLRDGRPAATISAVRYLDEDDAPALDFIGLYIVVPGLRGHGYGLRLWDHALAGLKAPTIGLDSVLPQQDTYRKDGFEVFRRNCRYEGRFGADGALPAGVRPLAEFPLAEVLAYDRRCFPARREAFLRAWLTLPGHTALGLERGGGLAGFGVIRPCGVGSKIGPLFADDDAAASALFQGLCASAPSLPVYFDVPMPHAGAVRLAESHGMRPVFETGRMYRGPAPEIDLGREFGVTSFELG